MNKLADVKLATTHEEFERIAEFVAHQKDDNLGKLSFQTLYQGYTVQTLANFIEWTMVRRDDIDLWYCTNEQGEIRYVLSIQWKLYKDGYYLTHANACHHDEDEKTNDTTCHDALFMYLHKVYAKHIRALNLKGRFWTNEQGLKWLTDLFTDALTIEKTQQLDPFGNIYRISVDLQKSLKNLGFTS